MKGRSCATCEWWILAARALATGECHGAPPQEAGWPQTSGDEWCAAFRLRENLCGGKDIREEAQP
jgi:hypothetical protein